MKWRLVSEQTGFLDLLSILSIFLGLFFLINNAFQFGFVILLFIIYYFASKFYLKHVADFLELENEKQKVRLYPNDTSSITLTFSQKGILPIMNGQLEFELASNVGTSLHTFDKQKDYAVYKMPIHLSKRTKQKINFDVIAKERCVARIKNITLRVQSLFGIGSVVYEFKDPFFTEIIVYPTLENVKGLETIRSTHQGVNPYRSSLYEDLTMQVGTRQYSEQDPFNRINWKASAKTNELQTKVFEKTTDLSWTIMLNVTEYKSRYSINIMEDIEGAISQLAYMAQVATHLNIPFSLSINFGTYGDNPFLSIEKGEGKEHLAKALEFLAYVSTKQAPIPMRFLLTQLDRKSLVMPIVFLIGEVSDKEISIYDKWKKKGTALYQIRNGAVQKSVMPIINERSISK
ncbi:hypothetical protein CIB95_04135 [Lottiidibacillus patelloidae]|uniref:Uncharacterized protein n=1 Tax=Lottiidibacillus patelloidae TaxID=2670334 RepID=A0A263BVH1_9BACI|nr:DUF58 domain-containing protein [Lottiidibacillus patelloidae]OZM57568.1 hypothetical protein CIB95_04135 [Lottiidibacillus patelloidae]